MKDSGWQGLYAAEDALFPHRSWFKKNYKLRPETFKMILLTLQTMTSADLKNQENVAVLELFINQFLLLQMRMTLGPIWEAVFLKR